MKNSSSTQGSIQHELWGIFGSWADLMYLAQMLNSSPIFNGMRDCPAIRNWSRFQAFLRQCGPETMFPAERFGGWDLDTNQIPATIMRWHITKRIFSLTAEMQERFENMSFGNMRMCDLVLPFSNFGIRFAKPITSGDALGTQFSFAMITDFFKYLVPGHMSDLMKSRPDVTGINAWGENVTKYQPFTREEKSKLEHLIRRGTKAQAAAYWQSLFSKIPDVSNRDNYTVLWKLSCEERLEDWFVAAEAEMADRVRQNYNVSVALRAIRLAINLCIYLQSIPAEYEQEEGTVWHTSVSSGIKPNAVIDGTKVCRIGGGHILDSMIRKGSNVEGIDQEKLRSVRPHWRRAHTRRPPGKGDDPLAPKTVKVRHALVCPDLLSETLVVPGSVSIINK